MDKIVHIEKEIENNNKTIVYINSILPYINKYELNNVL